MSDPTSIRADILLHGAYLLDPAGEDPEGDAIALADGRILAVGFTQRLAQLCDAQTSRIDCSGLTLMPGLIDGHAHLDREGLKDALPSLSGATSIARIQDILRGEVARHAPGDWIILSPLGTAPLYLDGWRGLADGRCPDRHDLDAAAPDNPVWIRPIWGYWSNMPDLTSVANTAALERAGIGRDTPSPHDLVTIHTDGQGLPDGRFSERTRMSIVEMTLMAAAPGFGPEARMQALARSVARYARFGTTGVFEGHGVAHEVLDAYQALRRRGGACLRAQLVISPSWTGATSADDIPALLKDWRASARRRLDPDDQIWIDGIYAEIDETDEPWLRAQGAPRTGWAGFHLDSGASRAMIRELLLEAARQKLRISTIFDDVMALMAEVDRIHPIAGLAWTRGHVAVMDEETIARVADMGLFLVTHTNRHIAKGASAHLARIGKARESDIVPLRRLLNAGIPVALGSDNLPPSLWHPVADVELRRDHSTGTVVGEDQSLTRREALTLATAGGARLLGRERELGRLAPGYLADIAGFRANVLTMPAEELRWLEAELTLVGGRIIHCADRPAI